MSDESPADSIVSPKLIGHLLELRRRLLNSALTLLLIFFCLFPFQNRVFEWVARPMIQRLPAGSSMIATGVAAPFMTPMKLCLVVALFLSVPVFLYHIWRFISPALYQRERRMFLPLLVSSVVLFYSGVAFAYFVLFPVAFAFLNTAAPEGVRVMTDINAYLDFVLTIFFAFGVAFEVPVVVVVLVRLGVVELKKLQSIRGYVIVGAFVVGAIFTPPDVLSQCMLAVPLWLLYEFGLLVARFVSVSKSETGAEQSEAAP